MHFAADEGKGFHIPFAWGHDSCQIVLSNIDTAPHAEAVFPFVFLAHLAAEVMESCVLESPAKLGGNVVLGTDDDFEVIVAGTGHSPGPGRVRGEDGGQAAVAVER